MPRSRLGRAPDTSHRRDRRRGRQQFSDRGVEGLGQANERAQRRIQRAVLNLLQVFEVKLSGVGRLLLRPAASSTQPRDVRRQVALHRFEVDVARRHAIGYRAPCGVKTSQVGYYGDPMSDEQRPRGHEPQESSQLATRISPTKRLAWRVPLSVGLTAFLGLTNCEPAASKASASASVTPMTAASTTAPSVASSKPALPPEPAAPAADLASEVPGFEAKLAIDQAYQGVWTGSRADLNLFLTCVSELLASSAAPADLFKALKTKKLDDAAIKLFLVHARIGRYPDDFTKKLGAHVDAVASEPHRGTWAPSKGSEMVHDFTALAAWLRPDDPRYLRELLAAKARDAGPIPWAGSPKDKPALRPWLVDETAALERITLLTPLTAEEQARVTWLIEEAKKTKLNEEFRLGEYTYNIKRVVTDIAIGSGYAEKRATEGARFVMVEFTIRNDSKTTQTVLTDDFRIVDEQAREFSPSSEANTALAMSGEKDFMLTQLQPGLTKTMHTAFEMPDAAAKGVITLVIPEKGGTGSVRISLK